MKKKAIKKNFSEKVFLCAYILMERRKKPEDRKFGPYLDLLPTTYSSFPYWFSDEEMAYLKGSSFE